MLAGSIGDTPDVNSTALLPGKICGQRWLSSPFANSVTGVGGPPTEGTCDNPTVVESAAMMLPFSPQLPPRPIPASHKVIAEPPFTEIFFSFPGAKNATHCPSGEKKGANPPCVPASSVAVG